MPSQPKTTKQLLKRARAMLAKKGGWTQGAFAIGKSGREVDYDGPAAVCFCLDGALMRAAGSITPLYSDAFRRLNAGIPGPAGLILWNDKPGRTQAQVVRLLDRAIAKA